MASTIVLHPPSRANGLFARANSNEVFVRIGIIVLATIAAMAMVPSNVLPPGALRTSALLMAAGLLSTTLMEASKNAAALCEPVNVVVAAPIYWLLLDPIQGAYDLPNLSQSDVALAFLAIGLFSAGARAAELYPAWRLPSVVRRGIDIQLAPNHLFSIATIAFVLSFLRFGIAANFDLDLMWRALFYDRFSAPWARGATGGWDAFLDHLSYFGYLLPSLAALIARGVGWTDSRTVLTVGYSIVIGALLASGGGRRIVGVTIGSAFLVWFLSFRPPRIRQLLTVSLLCAGLLAVMQLMLIYRGLGLGKAAQIPGEEVRAPDYLHVDDNFLRTCEIIAIIPSEQEHVTWRWLLWVVVRPIPRVLWPSKPMDPGFSMGEYHGIENTSLTMSLVGELYMSFGFLGCAIGGWFMGRMAQALRSTLDGATSFSGLLVFGSGLFALFTGIRSGIELVLMSYVTLAWLALAWAYSKLLEHRV